MNTEKLKSIYENMPKQLKYVMAPVFLYSVLGNKEYKKTYHAIEQFENLTEEEKNIETLSQLKEILVYAYNHTPYYNELFNSIGFDPEKVVSFADIERIPFMTKEIAVAQGDRMYSDESIPCYEAHTSGSSTGKVFRMLLDKRSIYKERAFVNHYLAKFGYNPQKTRTLAFWGHNKDADYYYSPIKNEIVISPFRLFKEDEFENVWSDITGFHPEMIAGYPSAIYIFAQLVRKYEKKLHLKLVEFYAENYTPEIKKYVEETFCCMATATYGHTERQVFGELYGNSYTFNGLYGYTELIPMEDEDGRVVYRIVCTGFNSRKMPMIRYLTDDAVVIDDSGLHVQGHTTSEARVIGKNGVRIYKGTLAPHCEPFEKVKQYQFVQYEEGKVYLDLVLDKPFDQDDFDILNAYYKRKCEGILEIIIRIVDKIKLNERGKYSWLVSNLKP